MDGYQEYYSILRAYFCLHNEGPRTEPEITNVSIEILIRTMVKICQANA